MAYSQALLLYKNRCMNTICAMKVWPLINPTTGSFLTTHTHPHIFAAFWVHCVPSGCSSVGNSHWERSEPKRFKWETFILLFCQIAKSTSPCGLPESPSSFPQISNFLGCSRSKFFLKDVPKLLSQKNKLHLIFIFIFSHILPRPSPSFSLPFLSLNCFLILMEL